jgi:DNA repair ATPase RecN
MKLTIKNFQSIENCELDIPEKSFTCLVGPTNIGKSAIRRALECVLYNRSEVSYIRSGSKECEVTLTLDDGLSIKWVRDKKTSTYEINGESYSKLSGTVPEILINKGFRELSLSKEKLNVQVAHQFENIFLLNQTGSKITEVLSNLGNLNRIIDANKQCGIDKKNIKSKLKIREEDNLLEKQKINSFTGIDDQKLKIEELKIKVSEIKNKKNKYDKLVSLKIKYDYVDTKLKELIKIDKICLPEMDKIDINLLNKLSYLNRKYSISENNLNKLNPIKKIQDITIDISQDKINLYFNLVKLNNLLSIKKYKYELYKNVPNIIDGLNINTDNLFNLKKLYEKINFYKNSIIGIRDNLKEEEINLIRLSDDYEATKKELKVCPLCDSKLI